MVFIHLVTALPFLWILILYLLLSSRSSRERILDEHLEKLLDYDSLSFVEAKKYSFDKRDQKSQTILAILVALFVGFKIVGILQVLAYVFLSYVFVGFFLFYIGLNRLHEEIVQSLLLRRNLLRES